MMKIRTSAGARVHRATLVGDVGFGLLGAFTDCGLRVTNWVEVVTRFVTCRACAARKDQR